MDSIHRYINTRISEKSQLLARLDAVILPVLPENCQSHVHTANFEQGVLTLIADSPVWAARLKTQQRNILQHLTDKLGLKVESIRIRFSQPAVVKQQEPPKRRTLSTQASDTIKNCADSVDDEALKESLLELSKRSDNKQS